MKKYSYKCVVCTCLFPKDEVEGFNCPVCTMTEGMAGVITDYVCKRCGGFESLRTRKKKDQLKRILELHLETYHRSIDVI